MVRRDVAAAGRRSIGIALALTAVLAAAAPVLRAGQDAAQPAAQAQKPKSPYVFGGDAGIILNFVKADKTADFEMIIARLKEALQKSEKPERKEQAASWRIFKAEEGGPAGSVLYVMLIEPSVKEADYSVSTLLAEAYPQEAQKLYDTFSAAFGNPAQNVLHLTLASHMGK
jgi:hypothetical protein